MRIDALLAAQGWDTLDTNAVRFEVQLPDGTRADYVLCDCHGRSLAVFEAKRYSVSPFDAAAQAKAYSITRVLFLVDRIPLARRTEGAFAEHLPDPVSVLRDFDGVQVGLTATPCVADPDSGGGDDEDGAFVRDTLHFFEVEAPTFSYKLKTAILFQQMRGRGTRTARNKATFTMFDFVGVSDHHGDDDDFANGGVVSDSQKRKKY